MAGACSAGAGPPAWLPPQSHSTLLDPDPGEWEQDSCSSNCSKMPNSSTVVKTTLPSLQVVMSQSLSEA